MAEIDRSVIENAVQERSKYILENIETLSLKQCRKLLEKDLGLSEKALDAHKALVGELVEKVVLSAQTEPGKKQQQSKQPVSSKAGNKENRNGNDKRKRKEISDEEEEEEEAEPRKNRRKGVQKAKSNKKPRGARGKAKADEEEDDSQDADDTSDGEATKRKNRKKKPAPRVAVKSGRSAGVQELQETLKRATITIPPILYVKHKSDSDLEQALEDLLAKHGLRRNADSRQVEKVKKKLQMNRDLEGIDPSNILEDVGRGSRRAARRGVNYAAVLKGPKLDLDDDEEEEDDDDDEDEEQEEEEDEVEDAADGGDEDGSDVAANVNDVEGSDDEESDEDGKSRGAKKSARKSASQKDGKGGSQSAASNERDLGGKPSFKHKKVVLDSDQDDEGDDDDSPKTKPAKRTMQAWSDDDDE